MKKLLTLIVFTTLLLTACSEPQKDKDGDTVPYEQTDYLKAYKKADKMKHHNIVYAELVAQEKSRELLYVIKYQKGQQLKQIVVTNKNINEFILENPDTKPYITIDNKNQRYHIFRQPYQTFTNNTFDAIITDKDIIK